MWRWWGSGRRGGGGGVEGERSEEEETWSAKRFVMGAVEEGVVIVGLETLRSCWSVRALAKLRERVRSDEGLGLGGEWGGVSAGWSARTRVLVERRRDGNGGEESLWRHWEQIDVGERRRIVLVFMV